MRSIALLLLSLACFPGAIFAQWTPMGPFGGTIHSGITIGNDLLVGARSGIFRSIDGGQTYTATRKVFLLAL